MAKTNELKALFFDIFGTCVDWRKTVTEALIDAAKQAGDTKMVSQCEHDFRKTLSLITLTQSRDDWAAFAQEWRTSYLTFTRAVAADPSLTWKTVDEHHLDSLRELLADRGLADLWSKEKVEDLSLIWHRLEPWSDTNAGLAALNGLGLQTATLTNGNLTLIENMVKHSKMPFKHVLSAEMFNSYKPNPAVYLGAAERLGLKPEQCGMVAAHLGDLEGAQKCGFATIYVERPEEEREEHLRTKEGLVDIWVEMDGGGFVEVAEKLKGGQSK